MTTVFIIIAIIWVVIPIIAKSNQQKAKAEAARQRAERAQAQQAAARAQQQQQSQPMRTTPVAPRVAPSRPVFPAMEGVGSYEGTGSQEGTGSKEGTGSREGRAGAVLQGERAHTVSTSLKTSPVHVVTVSSISGHAHQETSATGIVPDCPPDNVTDAAPVSAQAGESAFLWDAAQARNGLVMAEILGPCLALRD